MKVSKFVLAALAVAITATLAFGQSAYQSTTSGSSGKYKIAVVAPNEGESIAVDQVKVVLTPASNAMGDTKTQVDVFLDDQQKGVIAAGQTEFRVEGVRPGPHKLVLIARNPVSDAVFDRREINFIATGAGSATTGVSSVSENAVGAHVPPAVSSTDKQHSYTATSPVEGTETYSSSQTTTQTTSSSTYSNPNPPPPPRPAPSTYSAPPPERVASNQPRMPKTASNDGFLAIAGAALLLTGVVLRKSA